MKYKRICFYGGTGSGKSTTAAGVFHQLKVRGINVELVTEYIKNWAYEERLPKSFQQMYIFAKQMNREDVLFPHVDCLVTDSPLLMNAAYSKRYDFLGWELIRDMAKLYEESFPGLHIFLDRTGISYQDEGRYEDANAASEMDRRILEMLDPNVPFTKLPSANFEQIVDFVVLQLEQSS